MRKYLIPLVSGGIILLSFLIFLVRDSIFSEQEQLERQQQLKAQIEEKRVRCLNLLSQLERQLIGTPLLQLERFGIEAERKLKGCNRLVPTQYSHFHTQLLAQLEQLERLKKRCHRQYTLLKQQVEGSSSLELLTQLQQKSFDFLEGECGEVVSEQELLTLISKRQKVLEGCLGELALLKEELKGAEELEELEGVRRELRRLGRKCSVISDSIENLYQLITQKENLYKRKIAKVGEREKWCRERLALWKGEATGATTLSLLRVVKERVLKLGKRCPNLELSPVLDLIAKREAELKATQLEEQQKLESCKSQLMLIREGVKGATDLNELQSYLTQGQQVLKECPSLIGVYRQIFKLALQRKEHLLNREEEAQLAQCRIKIQTLKNLIQLAKSEQELNRLIFKLQNLECPKFATQIAKLVKIANKRIEELEEAYLQCDKKYQELELRFQRAKGFFHSDRVAIAQVKGEAMELRDKGVCRPSTLRELEKLIEKCDDEL
ncbi:MAG: hypothetical protein ABGW77_04325 [Campylobacterales bacterium]